MRSFVHTNHTPPMNTPPFSNYDFLANHLFRVDFDYDLCMKQAFFKDLYRAFEKECEGTSYDEEACYWHTFSTYLHSAHKVCALLTMYTDKKSLYTYEQMYEVAVKSLHYGDEDDEMHLFSNHDIFLILHLVYAILAAKGTENIPFELIELAESHLISETLMKRDIGYLNATYKDDVESLSGIPFNLEAYRTDETMEMWTEVREQIYKPLKKIVNKYQSLSIHSSIKLRAKSWHTTEWPQEDLTQWVCMQTKRTTKYDKHKAQHFIRFWSSEERQTVIDAIEEWSKQHPEAFKDREQAITELRAYNTKLPSTEPDDTAIPLGEGPIRLKYGTGFKDNKIIDIVRIFYVMHEQGMFTHAYKNTLTKDDLFIALATFFDCPQLTDWSNKMSSAKSQSNNHLEIFETLKKKMGKIQNK